MNRMNDELVKIGHDIEKQSISEKKMPIGLASSKQKNANK